MANSLDSGVMGFGEVADLDEIGDDRRSFYELYDYKLPLQDAERQAGLTEADVWRFLDDPAHCP
ncbi:MAG: hypothetical protein QM658_05915 [Gordonia sp. (in: high G+C Gram-positive bacteria)]